MLRLERPLVVFDLESTGTSTDNDRIIELALLRFEPGETAPSSTVETRVNPECPIPAAITELTGISDYDVRDAPRFREVVDKVSPLIADADLCGYHAAGFDVPLLEAEFSRCGRTLPGPVDREVLDPCVIFKKNEPHTLEKAVAFYLGRPLDGAHTARADTEATYQVLMAQIQRYDLDGSASEIARLSRHPFIDSGRRLAEEKGRVTIQFGKYKGTPLARILQSDPDYVQWMKKEMGSELRNLLEGYERAFQEYMGSRVAN